DKEKEVLNKHYEELQPFLDSKIKNGEDLIRTVKNATKYKREIIALLKNKDAVMNDIIKIKSEIEKLIDS
ncbi:MAG: hypothetical protein HY513_04700, partial [Candidatus Aenigmarchaeota archaeon]|nr:hypothetical protein [Candidatus Aenigmarchaeota archaeon]